MPSLQAGILNILWWEKGGFPWREWTLGKMVGKEDEGRWWTLVGRSLGLGRYSCCFLNIPEFALFQCFSTFQQCVCGGGEGGRSVDL
jgi:hypothetical protein